MEDSRHDLSNRSDAVGKVLLAGERRETTIGGRPRRGQVQKMPDEALPDRCEGVTRELLEDIIQTADRFLGEHTGHSRVLADGALHSQDIHEIHRTVSQRLYEDRCGTGDQRRRTEHVTASNVADGDLAAVAGEHVHAEKPSHHDPEALGVRLLVDGCACGDIELTAGGREMLHGLDRQGSPMTLTQQGDRLILRPYRHSNTTVRSNGVNPVR